MPYRPTAIHKTHHWAKIGDFHLYDFQHWPHQKDLDELWWTAITPIVTWTLGFRVQNGSQKFGERYRGGGGPPWQEIILKNQHFVDQQNVRSKFCWSTIFLVFFRWSTFWWFSILKILLINKILIYFFVDQQNFKFFCWSTFWEIWAMIDASVLCQLVAEIHSIFSWISYVVMCLFLLRHCALRSVFGWLQACMGLDFRSARHLAGLLMQRIAIPQVGI